MYTEILAGSILGACMAWTIWLFVLNPIFCVIGDTKDRFDDWIADWQSKQYIKRLPSQKQLRLAAFDQHFHELSRSLTDDELRLWRQHHPQPKRPWWCLP